MIIGIKQLTIDEIDKDRLRHVDSDEELGEGVDQDVQTLRKSDMPSMEAMAKLEDFRASYHVFIKTLSDWVVVHAHSDTVHLILAQ